MTALNNVVPPDDMLVHGNATPTAPDSVWELKRASEVEGTDFRDARGGTDINGRPNIHFTLTTEAGEALLQVHRRALPHQLRPWPDGHRTRQQGA